MPKDDMSYFVTKTCPQCGEARPTKLFSRVHTAAQVIRDHEAARARGTPYDPADPFEYVVEWDQSELDEAAEEGRVLPRYKHIKRVPYESRVCIECKPRAPWEGDMSNPTVRRNAEALGIIASMKDHEVNRATSRVERQREKTLKRVREGSPMVRRRRVLMKDLRKWLAKESMSARNKMRYIETRKGDKTPYLFECVLSNLALVQAVHLFITEDMKTIPSAVWQAALRAPAASAVVGEDDVLPLVALASDSPGYATVRDRLVEMRANFDRYLAQQPKYTADFPFLRLFWSQAEGIERLYKQLFALALLDEDTRGPRAVLLASAPDPVLHDGEAHLLKALDREEKRVQELKRLYRLAKATTIKN